jgi:hypothetical protein
MGMHFVEEIFETPAYDAAGAVTSKTAMFTFIAAFIYLVFTSEVGPGVFGGVAFFAAGIIGSSLLVAMPLFLLSLKLRLPTPVFSISATVLTIAFTMSAYSWLF